MNRTNKFINKSIQLAIAPLLATGILFPFISSNTANVTNNITSTEENYSYQRYENDPLPGFGFTYKDTDYYLEVNDSEIITERDLTLHVIGDETKTFGDVANFEYEWEDTSGVKELTIRFKYQFKNYLPRIGNKTYEQTFLKLLPGDEWAYSGTDLGFVPILYSIPLLTLEEQDDIEKGSINMLDLIIKKNSWIKIHFEKNLGQFTTSSITARNGNVTYIPSEKTPNWRAWEEDYTTYGVDNPDDLILKNTYDVEVKIDFSSMFYYADDLEEKLENQVNMLKALWKEFYFDFAYSYRFNLSLWPELDDNPIYDNIRIIFDKIQKITGNDYPILYVYWHQYSPAAGESDTFSKIDNANYDRGAYIDNLDDKYPTIDPIEPDKPLDPVESKDNRIWIWVGSITIIFVIIGVIGGFIATKKQRDK